MADKHLGKLFSDGEIIFRQGERADCLYIIQSGKVVVYREHDGKEFKLAELGAGDFFGEMGILMDPIHTESARSLGGARLITADYQFILKKFSDDPSFVFRVFETMAKRVRERTEELKKTLENLHLHQEELAAENLELRESRRILEESRNQYSDLYDFAPVGYIDFDEAGIIRGINLTGATMLGTERAFLREHPFTPHLVPEDRVRFRNHLLECKHSSGKVSVELALDSKDRAPMKVQLLSTLYRGSEGTFCRTIMTDITEIKQIEQALQMRTERQKALTDLGIRALSVGDFPSLVNEVVLVSSRLLGAELSCVLEPLPDRSVDGLSVVIGGLGEKAFGVLTLVKPEARVFSVDDVNFLKAMANILETALIRKRSEEQLDRYHRHLEELVSERTSELSEANQRLTTEIAERQKAEEKLAYLASFPERNTNPVVEMDLSGKCTYINPAADRLLPGLREAGAKHPWLAGLEPEIRSGRQGDAIHALRSVEIQGRHYLQTILFVPETQCVRIYSTDVTERKQMEERLRHSQRIESLGLLAGAMAHEFNNMMTVVNGYAEMLLSQLPKEGAEHREVGQIREAGTRVAGLTRQLLAFGGKQLMIPEVVDLGATVTDMTRMLQQLVGEQIRTEVRVSPGLWKVKVEPGQFEQVIVNLAINARDAMPNGGSLTIEMENVPGPYVKLAVVDTGIGMDEETKSRLFEPFFTTHEGGQGKGLGLSTVYGIVMQSGGQIRVESEKGQGATFEVFLPRAAETRMDSKEVTQEITPGGEGTILLVEDEAAVRDLAQEILEAKGYRVLAAGNGLEALSLCAGPDCSVELLLTDVVMPGMSGKELADILLGRFAGLKVLFMSGYAGQTIAQQGILSPDAAFLQKPFSHDELRRKVGMILQAGKKAK